MIQLKKGPGTVYLVGAGPGDPELISVRGARLLQKADALVYDRLVHPDLIDESLPRTEKIYVGKAAGRTSIPQSGINALLIELAKKYQTVVRLKGGDPFIYGRGSEEALALRASGIPFEVVPGISSSSAVPACAGIPLTHRGVAQSFAVVTGHSAQTAEDIDLVPFLKADTLVVMMGLRRLAILAQKLIEHGKPSDTPVAAISCGSTVNQQTVVGTLGNIGALARRLPTPAVVVVGQVVAFHDRLAWKNERNHERDGQMPASVFTEHIYAVSA